MFAYLVIAFLAAFGPAAYGTLAGGRPNAFSEGQNAFAGVVNPANAVWIADRFDIGTFLVYQKSSLNNKDNNPLFVPGKMSFTYKSRSIFTADAAIHKRFKLSGKDFDSSCSLAFYTMPSYVQLKTKQPIPIAGTTPIGRFDRTDVASLVFSFKCAANHSLGCSIDYLYLSHKRNGYQHTDNVLRSVAPGHVTNNGVDHAHGIGLTIGWRWNINDKCTFGAAWSRKTRCGQFSKYRGFEPRYAKNFTPQTLGAGFSCRMTSRLAGRVEVLWMNLGNLPGANNNVLSNGKLNLHRRGSKQSPGPGFRDATFLNIGLGYQFIPQVAVGVGLSHRFKFNDSSNILSHTYRLQTIYDILSLGANLRLEKHDLFFTFSYGFKNTVSGKMPLELRGGRFVGEKQNISLSFSWGYKY